MCQHLFYYRLLGCKISFNDNDFGCELKPRIPVFQAGTAKLPWQYTNYVLIQENFVSSKTYIKHIDQRTFNILLDGLNNLVTPHPGHKHRNLLEIFLPYFLSRRTLLLFSTLHLSITLKSTSILSGLREWRDRRGKGEEKMLKIYILYCETWCLCIL